MMAEDEEPSVAQLLQIHGSEVGGILDRIRELDSGGTCIVDEVFVLRFVLDNKVNAEANIRQTLAWRQANRDALLRARHGELPFEDILSKNVRQALCGWLGEQYLVMVVRAGHGNPVGIMRELTVEQVAYNMLIQHEHFFALVDERTRQTGKLCKIIMVIDLQGFKMKKFDRRFAKAMGDDSHLNAVYYPQLIKHIVIINLPAAFRFIYSFAKIFSSRATLEKQKICPARTAHRTARECPFLAKFGAAGPAAVPHFLGGTFPLSAGLRLDEEEMDES